MANGSQTLTTYYAKRIIGDSAANTAATALLQTGENITTTPIWILSRTNRATDYGIKYTYDSTNGDKIEFVGGASGSNGTKAWVKLDTGDVSFSGILTVTNTTDCTAKSTGAVQISGGLYVAKQLRINDNLTIYTQFNRASISDITANAERYIQFISKDSKTFGAFGVYKYYASGGDNIPSNTNRAYMIVYNSNSTNTHKLFSIYAPPDNATNTNAFISWTDSRVGNSIYPYVNNSYTLGSTDLRWSNGYFTTSLLIGSASYTSTTSNAAGTTIGVGQIDLSASTPAINFHFNNSTSAYTSRIIESASGYLKIESDVGIGDSTTGHNLEVYGTTTTTNSITAAYNGSHIFLKNTQWTKGTTPESQTWSALEFLSNDSTHARVALLEATLDTSGNSRLHIYLIPNVANSDAWSGIILQKTNENVLSVGINGTNTNYTFYVNGTSGFANNIYMTITGKGLYLVDSASKTYAGIYDNGSNLWIGATSSTGQHHKGGTYISAGHNGTSGNKSIYISIPTNGNASTTHTSYALVYKDATGSATQGIYTDADGKTAAMTYSLSATVNASGNASRIAYYSGKNAISGGTVTTDGAYFANISYLTVNTDSQTSYRFYVNGTSYFNGNTTHNGYAYFANGTTYYINSSGTANLYGLTTNDTACLKSVVRLNNANNDTLIYYRYKVNTKDTGYFGPVRSNPGSGDLYYDTRFRILQYSYNSSSKARLDTYEYFDFPSVTADRSSSASYSVLTTKSTITTAQGGTGNTSYTASRLLYTNTATKFASGSIVTDGGYLGSVSYLSINKAHQTSYRLWCQGSVMAIGNYESKHETLDITSTTNGISSDVAYGWYFDDKNGKWAARVLGYAQTNGNTRLYLQARNYNGSTDKGSGGITIIMANDGTVTYSVSAAANFRSAIGLGTAATKNESGTWAISVSGSSASCTGNAATADKWKTARTLTIGNKGQSVDGSGNVSWALQDVLIMAGNEFNFTANGMDSIWFNYRNQSASNTSTKITKYNFGNGQKSTAGVTIQAGTFSGDLSGNAATATKATQDSDGNTIKSTYLKLSGGTMTGNLYYNGGTSTSNREAYRAYANGDTGAWWFILRNNTPGTASAEGFTELLIGNGKNSTTAWNSSGKILLYDSSGSGTWMCGRHGTLAGSARSYVYFDEWINPKGVVNAVWNDYAECRAVETEEPGYCVTETNSGIMIKTHERLQAGCKITSDTFGSCMGETDIARTPIAVAGRVLVYPYRAREEYELGAAVCSAPNGTVDIMTRDEIMMYPERIVGTVSEIPTYEIWHGGDKENPDDILVNGRIWIYIR